MTSSPEPTDLIAAWHRAAAHLDVSVQPGTPWHHGLGGRTLSGPAIATDGLPVWLRVMSVPKPGGKVWEGAKLAEDLIGDDLPRPALLDEHTWGKSPAFQALLWQRMSGTVLSNTPDLGHSVKVSADWWDGLRSALDHLRGVPAPPGREVLTQAYVNRIPGFIPQLRDIELDLSVRRWETSHGDLHWANLADPLSIIDWEGWGAAPAGFDAATLHAYSLAQPDVAAKVRDVFADVLSGEEGRLAHLVIAAEIIQASERDEVHARLAPYVQRFSAELLFTALP